MAELDTGLILKRLRLVGHGKKARWVDLVAAVIEPPVVTWTIDGASTLELSFTDRARTYWRSRLAGERSWARAAGINFELAAVAKAGDVVTLTFEDAIAAALRRRKKKLSIPAGTISRRTFATRLAKEAGVRLEVDPANRGKVQRVLERSTHGDETNSWDVLGEAADDVAWRRFSNGRALVFGSDDWLLERDADPTRLREYAGPVEGAIDTDLDVGKRAATAGCRVKAEGWGRPPGAVVRMGDDMGPAEGRWLVGSFTWALTSEWADLELVRGRHAFKEPRKAAGAKEGSEAGSDDFLPDQEGDRGAAVPGNSPLREALVAWALDRVGADYREGALGPDAYDASGFIEAATTAVGKPLTAPGVVQWAESGRVGARIAVSRALGTRGALLYAADPQGPQIAVSLGNGSTVEANGRAYGVAVLAGAAERPWTGGILWV